MPENTQLLIYNPCHEQWDTMQPDAEGRFCGSCQKTVVDFTTMSDQELLAWFARGRGNVCGRMTEDQLNRDLVPARTPKKRAWAVWWQFLVAGLLVSSKASSQAKPPKAPMGQVYDDTASNQVVMGFATIFGPSQFIRIIDSATQKPLPGASVQVNDDPKYFIADSTGKIRIPYEWMADASVLKVSCIGYADAVIPVDRKWTGVDKVVRLSPHPKELPAVSVIGYGTIRCSRITGEVVTVRVEKNSMLKSIKDALFFRKSPLTLYPNPVTRGTSVTLSLRMGMPGSYMAQLYSGEGMVVESMRIEGVDGPRTELMDISGTLAAGVYFVRVFHLETGKMYTEKVVVL
jgi:hypothetical protein